jgi:hypothetical protein
MFPNLLTPLLHACVARGNTVIKKERCLPVIIVSLGQIPGVVGAQSPHVRALLSISGNHNSLYFNEHLDSSCLQLYLNKIVFAYLIRVWTGKDIVARGDQRRRGQHLHGLLKVQVVVLEHISS